MFYILDKLCHVILYKNIKQWDYSSCLQIICVINNLKRKDLINFLSNIRDVRYLKEKVEEKNLILLPILANFLEQIH